jgi:hypothetical protein
LNSPQKFKIYYNYALYEQNINLLADTYPPSPASADSSEQLFKFCTALSGRHFPFDHVSLPG